MKHSSERTSYVFAEPVLQNPRLEHIIEGLDCVPYRLTEKYWSVLHRCGLIRTAEEEERRRFTAAAVIPVPRTEFAMAINRLIHACIQACPRTKDITAEFVEAGQLHLQLFYSPSLNRFRIHERWLDHKRAVKELGLPPSLKKSRVLYHAIKQLFSNALEQLPDHLFQAPEGTAKRMRSLEVNRAEERLLDYLRIQASTMTALPSRPSLRIVWSVDLGFGSDTPIEIQCHSASTCSHYRDDLSLLLAGGGEFNP